MEENKQELINVLKEVNLNNNKQTEELNRVIEDIISNNNPNQEIIIEDDIINSLPKEVIDRLKQLGYKIMEKEPNVEKEDKDTTKKEKLTATITVLASVPDPNYREKYPNKDTRDIRNQLHKEEKGNNYINKFSQKEQTLKDIIEQYNNSNNKEQNQNQSNGYIDNINFDGKTATCTIHYTTPEERISLEAKA